MRAVGSSTVYPFAKIVAERIARANPRLGTPIIESTGTGAGMKLFCAGVGERFPDVENASRRMKASEAKLCAAERRHPDHRDPGRPRRHQPSRPRRARPLQNLTQRDIYLALAKTPFGKPNRAKTWHDVNGKPAERFRSASTARRRLSGTRDALGELIMTPPCEANPAMAALKKSDETKFKAICTGVREDGGYIEAGENDNLIVQKIEANPGTIGIFGYSYLEENAGQAEGHRRSTASSRPTQTISGFKYPGARPLYIYIKNAHVGAIPAVRAYASRSSPRKARSARTAICSAAGMIPAPNTGSRAQPAGGAGARRRSTWRASSRVD